MQRAKYLILAPIIAYGTFQLISCAAKDEDTTPATEAATSGRPGAGGTSSTSSGSSGSSGSTSSSSCSLTENTTATSTENAYGCALLTRDTTSCQAEREAQGLSGFWLKFSCNVTLTKSGNNVVISAESLPDTKSFYYNSTDPCYESFSSSVRSANPNKIASQTIEMTVPYSPSPASSSTATSQGVIGIAVNGVSIYNNEAAPGDSIYEEEATFDKCDGHPDSSSRYHYHTEPSPISNSDSNFVGVLRDGYPVYGRYDYETGTTVTGLDSQGGKTGKTADSPNTAVYHYHINLQSEGSDSAYFISAGSYKGTVGSCTGCQ